MNQNRKKGYTLAEVMMVAGILALVGSLATVGLIRHREEAEDVRTQGELTSIYKAMEAYRQVYGRYPSNNGELRPFVSIPNFDQRYEINPNP